LLAAIADGAGSAARGGAGAALAVRAVVGEGRAALGRGEGLTEDAVRGWIMAARARVLAAAADRGVPARDCATTLIVAATDGRVAVVGHVGDGAAAARDPEGWAALSWPELGEHAGETRFLTDPEPAIRTARKAGPISALAMLTDGLERLVLDFAACRPHAPFFERMTAPLTGSGAVGVDRRLSAALADWLGGAAVAARTDDDRALILAVLG
jgi:hypothetical protein